MNDESHSTREILEQLCWYLSYHPNEPLTASKIATELNIEWKDAYNYTIFLNALSNIAPTVSYETYKKEFNVTNVTKPVSDALSDPAVAATVYLFRVGMFYGDVLTPIRLSEHTVFTNHVYSNGLNNAVELGWIRVKEDEASLTPTGCAVAGPVHSSVRNLGGQTTP